MRVAALVIGIFGAFAAFIGAVVALAVGGLGEAVGADDSGTVVIGGVVAIGMSIVGLVGAALAIAKPRLASVLMLTSAVVGLIAIFVAYILATVLFLIAAALAFLGRQKSSKGEEPTAVPVNEGPYCRTCGQQFAVDSKFCNACGSPA